MIRDNPEFIRHALVQLARPRAFWAITLFPAFLFVGIVANLMLWRYGGEYRTLADCAKAVFVQLLAVNYLVLTLAGTARVGAAVAAEHTGLTLDAQRLTPIDPRVMVVGRLLGVPIRGWLHAAASLPFAAVCVIADGVAPGVAVQCGVLLVAASLFSHSLALIRFRPPKPTESGGGAVVLAIFFTTIGFSLSSRAPESLLTLLSIGPHVRHLIEFGEATISPFGTDLPAVPLCAAGLLAATWLVTTAAARTLRDLARPPVSRRVGLLVLLLVELAAVLIALPTQSGGGAEHDAVAGLAVALFAAGLVFVATVAVDPFDLAIGMRIALRGGSRPRWGEDRASAVPAALLAAAGTTAVLAAFALRLPATPDAVEHLVWRWVCAGTVGLGILSHGLLMLSCRLVSRSGRLAAAAALSALHVAGGVAFGVLESFHHSALALVSAWTCPLILFFGEREYLWKPLGVVGVLGFAGFQAALGIVAWRFWAGRHRLLAGSAARTLKRAGMLATAVLLAAGAAGGEPQATTADVAPGLHVYRVEFWCTQSGWESGAPESQDPMRAGREPVYRRFLVWDTADRGVHPETFDVAAFVANDTGQACENVAVVLRQRRLLGPVVRRPDGEFAGLIDRRASLTAARWSEADEDRALRHVIRRIEPGARKKIIFHGVSLGAAPAELRAVRPFCWKVEYSAEACPAGSDGARLSRGIGVLDVAIED